MAAVVVKIVGRCRKIKVLEYEELNYSYSKMDICLKEALFERIDLINLVCAGNIVIGINKDKCKIYYTTKKQNMIEEVRIWPAIRIRVESSIREFLSKLEEINWLIDNNETLSKKKYCKIRYYNKKESYIISDIYVRGTILR